MKIRLIFAILFIGCSFLTACGSGKTSVTPSSQTSVTSDVPLFSEAEAKAMVHEHLNNEAGNETWVKLHSSYWIMTAQYVGSGVWTVQLGFEISDCDKLFEMAGLNMTGIRLATYERDGIKYNNVGRWSVFEQSRLVSPSNTVAKLFERALDRISINTSVN